MFTTTRRALPALALLLTFLAADARPAQAQTFTRAQVHQMLKTRLMQAIALNGLIQQLSASPAALVPGSAVQSTIAQYQGALASVQYQINQLQLLRAALNQAFAVDRLLQNSQKQTGGQHHHGRKNQRNQQQTTVTQANLQTALATIQAQISSLQATIVVP